MFYRARRFLRAGRAVGTNRRRILPNTVGRVHIRSNEARFREVPPTHSMALAPRGSEADPLDAPGISPAHTPRTLHTASPVQQNVLLDPKSGDEGQQVAISVHCVLIISSAGPEMERSKMTQTGPRDGTAQNDTKGTPRWDNVPPYHLTYNKNNKLTGPGSPGPVQDRSRSRGRRLSRAAGGINKSPNQGCRLM